MPWLMFGLALLSFVVLCYAHSLLLGFVCVIAMLGFFFTGIVQLMAARMGSNSRDSGHIITPEELRMYREQAQARQQAAANPAPPPAPPAAAPAAPRDEIIDGEFQEVGKVAQITGPTDAAPPPPSTAA
ncbi:MAG: hypothetical protein JSR26_00285 [Proteobacteria bacterium]|nr:hypothetical protein [Pseudomonadota bacterium]